MLAAVLRNLLETWEKQRSQFLHGTCDADQQLIATGRCWALLLPAVVVGLWTATLTDQDDS